MEELLEPINYINSGLLNLGSDIIVNLQSIRDVINNVRDAITTIVITLIMMVVKFILGIIIYMLKTHAIFGKLTDNILLLTNGLKSSTLALGSAWNGQPGNFIRNIAKVA